MLRFDGKKSLERRAGIENDGQAILSGVGVVFRAYRKTVLTFAAEINQDFEVDTLEGLHTGKAGDFLAVGPAGEMYPIDKAVFDVSYVEAE